MNESIHLHSICCEAATFFLSSSSMINLENYVESECRFFYICEATGINLNVERGIEQ